jgi:DNA-directed RNA polymerase specialized sigma24 family protein
MTKDSSSHKLRWMNTSASRVHATGWAIAHLPSPVRWVMLLGGQHGLSTKEIANLSGVSMQAVKAIQNRGRELIEAELQTLN